MKENRQKYNQTIQRAREAEQKAEHWEKRGDGQLARIYRMNAENLRERANALKAEIDHIEKNARSIRKKKKTTGSRSGRKLTTDDMIAGIFRGVEKATGKNYATDTLQYATTPEECKVWLRTVKAMFTDAGGKLDKKGYCNALNYTRDNMLFTAGELQKAIEDARRSGNDMPIPGYETLINQHQTNAGLLADEIRANGGKVNK